MTSSAPARWLLLVLPFLSCTPLTDLDAAARGEVAQGGVAGNSGGTVTSSGGNFNGGTFGGTTVGGSQGGAALGGQSAQQGGHAAGNAQLGGTSSPASGGVTQGSGGASAGSAVSGGAPQAGALSSGGVSVTGGAEPVAAGAGSGGSGDATELPIDLPNSPVTGNFRVSEEATWEVEGTHQPTFEIHTPTASYWVVKPLGMIVSLVDTDPTDARQWIDFSSGFRPLRGLPSYGTFGATEAMVTTVDTESQTPTHLRLNSKSVSGNWRLVWDFYPTHVTVTINSAPLPYGFAYRGVPAGLLDGMDLFVLPDDTQQSAQISHVADLAGPVEWAYLSDSARGRSLFLIQHTDDALVDRYQVKDNDSAMLSFGDGKLQRLPMRFSFGVIRSVDPKVVSQRAKFVIDAIH